MLIESTKNVTKANNCFRFAQLSDLHISSPRIPAPWRLCNKRILGYLSWLKKRRRIHQQWVADLALQQLKSLQVDHYLITGDLTHIGLETEFKQIAHWLSDQAAPQDLTVIPGNHDLYVNEKWQRSFTHWESYMRGDSQAQNNAPTSNDALRNLEDLYPIVRIRGNTAFIAVSSIFDAPWFRATGKINQSQLQRLQDLLTQPVLDEYCKVLLIHHPITLEHTVKRKSLLNHEALLSTLRDTPVQLVLHGHGHPLYFRKRANQSNN